MAARAASPRTVDVETPVGPARLHAYRATRARAVLVLGHGAGRGSDTDDLLGLARDLPAHGVAVVLVDQPWVLAGRKVAAPPATLDVAWRAVLPHVRRAAGVRASVPLVAGGRSAGARVACRTAVDVGAAGLLLLAFPLHPPGAARDAEALARSVGIRTDELAVPLSAGLPVVVAQGDRDTFGGPAEVADAAAGVVVVAVPAADHGLRAPRTAAPVAPVLLSAALDAVARAGA